VKIGSGDRTFQNVDGRINFPLPASFRAGLCRRLFVELDQDLGISIDALIELIVGIGSVVARLLNYS
ncbi:MAG: hypothetical protein WB814_15750, partial [Candidatus Sulfotelmatobacter sp.]